jgi:translation initiation factor IF-1
VPSDDAIPMTGIVASTHPGDTYKVTVDIAGQSRDVLARRCGRLNRNFIKIIPGDEVTVEVSGYDLSRGRITQRLSGRSADAPARR